MGPAARGIRDKGRDEEHTMIPGGVPPMPAQPPAPTSPVPLPDDVPPRAVNPLWLEGWDSYSTWGWDPAAGSYYAQLYRDEDDREGPPRVWVDGVQDVVRHLPVLYMRVALATGEPLTSVYQAFLHWLPEGVHEVYRRPSDPVSPQGRLLGQVRYQLGEVSGGGEYAAGSRDALRWVCGQVSKAPCSAADRSSGGWPAAVAVRAEEWAATAAVYMTRQQERAAGVETALRWVQGAEDAP